MTARVILEPTADALALQRALHRWPDDFRQAIKKGLTEGITETTTRIKENRLSGKGPFPIEEHRLGVVTGLLRGTTQANPATVILQDELAIISASISTDVPYAAVHEYGFVGEQNVRAHLRESKTGKIFPVRAFSRVQNIPARAPFHTGVQENLEFISAKIEGAITEAVLQRQ